MKKALLIFATALALSVVGGCSEQNEQTQASAPQGGQQPPAQAVSVVALQPQAVKNTVTLPGRVSALRQSQVRPQVNGVITKRLFEEGATVEKGQQLYQIDDARYKAELASAKADLESAQANLKTMEARSTRYKDLLAKNSVSAQEYDDALAQSQQAQASIAVAEASLQLAQVNLDYTKVYAPISGQISRSMVTVGTLVTANQEQQLATITQLDPIYVDMQQSGKSILQVRRAMQAQKSLPVELSFDESTGQTYEHQGELKFSEVTVDETTGAVTLRAVFPNEDSLLMPGMFVKAAVTLSTDEQLLVPQRATTRQPDGSLVVFIVNGDNKVEARTLQTDGAFKDQYIVTGGLQQGDRVIVTGYQKVQPGAQVNPSPWKKD
ncbi:efflux RND transporter periplasmic adaptor subunit [Alteromonas pelagimontana]|uniref:Efflux RND transporter periplasmic adaptor subunit n=1 Tax=Alteromonas pelagimontana TaxID=1858656 RepID=A0A6M4MDH2_9ALTE|nr:efflux RND transporter periplasmic adaptor subunit [Alteromonas pelagimontana]QJR81173.1 efflux RND transporter periplasmic adaptor subunit [Alteromonas pelagimontana]